ALFPYLESIDDIEKVLLWMIGGDSLSNEGREIWMNAQRFSADELMDVASLSRLYEQRKGLRRMNYSMLERNFNKSVFYQLDLSDVANDYIDLGLPVPSTLTDDADVMHRIHNRMLRSRFLGLKGDMEKSKAEELESFALLRNGLIN